MQKSSIYDGKSIYYSKVKHVSYYYLIDIPPSYVTTMQCVVLCLLLDAGAIMRVCIVSHSILAGFTLDYNEIAQKMKVSEAHFWHAERLHFYL